MERQQQVQKTAFPQQTATPTPANFLQSRPFAPVENPPVAEQQEKRDLRREQIEWERRINFERLPVSPPQPLYPQPKLTLGFVEDKYEQEADRVAQQVVQRLNMLPTQELSIQRQEMLEDDEKLQMKSQPLRIQRKDFPKQDKELQRWPIIQRVSSNGGMAVTDELEASIHQARGRGQPLLQRIRQPMEQAFGADFSGVRVHADPQSDQLNQSIQARAFTTGQDVFFGQGEYNPGSQEGQELLAHELTHVVQQNGSSVVQREPAENAESMQQETDPTKDKNKEISQPLIAQTNLYVIQRAKKHQGQPNKPIYDYRGTPVIEDQGGKNVPKQLAQEVEAVIPQKPPYGGVPQVDPAGWYWLAQHIPAKIVAHTTTGKTSLLQRPGWVRFHLLNANLGGSGKKEENLVPTRQSDNLSSQWSSFETNAKDQSQLSPIHFYVKVDYYAASPATFTNPGNIHLGFFPNKIDADYSTWDGMQWNIQDNVTLTPQPPGTTTNLVQYELTTASQSELKALGIDNWLIGWIVYLRDTKKQLVLNNQTTKQGLYNIIFQAIPYYSTQPNVDQNKLNAYWKDLENALNKTGGLELHIVLGNRGGAGNVSLGKSMNELIKKTMERKKDPQDNKKYWTSKEKQQSIQILCSNRLQELCVHLITEYKLIGDNWDQNVSEHELYKKVIQYSTIKEIPEFDANWTTDLFAPMKDSYILPIDREPFPKITEQIEILKQELANKLNQEYYSNSFVNNTPEVQEFVDICYNAIIKLTPQQHFYQSEKLEKIVNGMKLELNQKIGIIYNRKQEEEKKRKEELFRQQQQQKTTPQSFGSSHYTQQVPLSHSQTMGVQYQQPIYSGGMPSTSIQIQNPQQQLQQMVSQLTPGQLLQLPPEQLVQIVPLLSPQQQLQLQQLLSQLQQISHQQQQGVPQSVNTSHSQTFVNQPQQKYTHQPSQYQQSFNPFTSQFQSQQFTPHNLPTSLPQNLPQFPPYQSHQYQQQSFTSSTSQSQYQQFPTQNPPTQFTEEQLNQVFSKNMVNNIANAAWSKQFGSQYQDNYGSSWQLLNFDWKNNIYYMKKV